MVLFGSLTGNHGYRGDTLKQTLKLITDRILRDRSCDQDTDHRILRDKNKTKHFSKIEALLKDNETLRDIEEGKDAEFEKLEEESKKRLRELEAEISALKRSDPEA
ncbi:hypothetical protein MHYP_G00094460 [Metynnis hypsauchen]